VSEEDKGPRLLPLLLALVSLTPQLGAALPLRSYYFRDFTVTFYPLRLFAAREFAAGRWPFWNPYIGEGAFWAPALYPPDLLHALWPGPAAVSWLLTLHFPVAALAAYALARELGADRWGGFVAGVAYSLGGLALSSLNLYVFFQALALAPLVALTLRRASLRGGASIPLGGLVLGVSLSTLAVEFVVQAVLLGVALGWAAWPAWRALGRMSLAVLLGLGLAAVPVAVTLGFLGESVRGAGFPQDVALANELHPVGLLQVLIPRLFGLPSVEAFWGARFFTKGFPYFLSLYLGPYVLALAACGVRPLEKRTRGVLLALGALGLWYALGTRGGLAPLLSSLPLAHSFRFPSKALLLPHACLALFAGVGASRLRSGAGWVSFGVGQSLALGIVLGVGGLLASAGDLVLSWGGVAPALREGVARALVRDCGVVAALALAGILVAFAVRLRRVSPLGGLLLSVALLVLDLDRAGTGMNPQVSPVFFDPLPEMVALHLSELDGGRVFSYGLDKSPAYRAFLGRSEPGTGLWSFFLNRQILAPYDNILDRVESVEAKDLTSFVPRPPVLDFEEYDPRLVGAVLTRLRNAAVSRLLSLDPLDEPGLSLEAEIPAGPPGLKIRVYQVLRPWPRFYVACHLLGAESRLEALERPLVGRFDPQGDVVLEEPSPEPSCQKASARRTRALPGDEAYELETDGVAYLVTRDSDARGWEASVDGGSAPVLRANGKHRAVRVSGGRHTVALRYRPPGLPVGLVLMTLSAAASLLLLRGRR
jgi:hypothetical protein